MKTILVISPIPTHPQIAGNRSRIFRLLMSLKEMGHTVHFLYVNTEPDKADEKQMAACWGDHFHFVQYRYPKRSLKRYAERLRFVFEKGFTEVFPVDYGYDTALDEYLRELSRKVSFDVVMVEYIFWSRALECFDGAQLKLLDTHDMFARRHLMYHAAGQEYGWYCTTEKEEAKGLNRADVVVAIQEEEMEYFSTLTDKKVILVRHIAPLHRSSPALSDEKRILFVGSDAGTNIHGVKYFTTEVLPRIRPVFPDLRLLLVGKVCGKVEECEGCIKLGEVEDLTSLYNSVDLVVNPIRFSTGLSIKTIEALGHSRPVVTTSAGSRGLEEGTNKAFLVADDPQQFSESVIKVLTDPHLSSRLSQSAFEFVERWNNESLKELGSVLS